MSIDKIKREYFPMFVPSRNKNVLVVGAGVIATRRVQTLLRFSFRVKVVSLEASDEIKLLARDSEIEYHNRSFDETDLDGMDIIISATNNREVNCKVGELARSRGIPVSVADRKEECTFYFPAVVTSGDIVLGITSEGKSHKLVSDTAKKLKKELNCEN